MDGTELEMMSTDVPMFEFGSPDQRGLRGDRSLLLRNTDRALRLTSSCKRREVIDASRSSLLSGAEGFLQQPSGASASASQQVPEVDVLESRSSS